MVDFSVKGFETWYVQIIPQWVGYALKDFEMFLTGLISRLLGIMNPLAHCLSLPNQLLVNLSNSSNLHLPSPP